MYIFHVAGMAGDSPPPDFSDAENVGEIVVQYSEYREKRRVEVARARSPIPLQNDSAGGFVVQWPFIGAAAPEGIVLVRQHDDPSLKRDLLPPQATGIPGAVPPFVVGQRDGRGHLQKRVRLVIEKA